jgi:hypothetical protein
MLWNRLEVSGLMPPTRPWWGLETPRSAEATGRNVTRPGGVEPPASSSAGKRSIHLSYGRSSILAERLGFEPRVDLSGLHALSRRAPSTTRPPLLNVRPHRQDAPYIDERRARDSNPHEPRGPVDFKSTALPVRTSPPKLWLHHGQERLLLSHGYPARNISTGHSRILWWCHSSSLGGVGQHLVDREAQQRFRRRPRADIVSRPERGNDEAVHRQNPTACCAWCLEG